jgi:hypothetical protein
MKLFSEIRIGILPFIKAEHQKQESFVKKYFVLKTVYPLIVTITKYINT